MNIDEVVDAYLEGAPDLQILRLEGFDDCCLGIIERCGDQPILFYSADRIVIKLIDGGLEPEAAHEQRHRR